MSSSESFVIPRDRFTELRSLPLSLQLGHFSAEILGWGFFEPRWWRNYLHIHSFFEVCYAYAGAGTFHICEADYPVQAGDVFVAKPGEPHEIISVDDDPLGIYFWSYTLVPPARQPPAASQIDSLLHAFLHTDQRVSAHSPTMQPTLDLLTYEITRQQAGYVRVIHDLVARLLLDTARAVTHIMPQPHPAQLTPYDSARATVQQITRYLHDNYSRPIQIRDVAAQVHLSERHTNRLFRRVMQVSINDYLTAYRLRVAEQLLLNRKLSVTEVAYACGYRDARYFITLFRRRTGLTPAAFRQQGGTHFL